ncbi:MAG: YceI family protein [Vicinamibacterales bacterium]
MRNGLSLGARFGLALVLGAALTTAPAASPAVPLSIGTARVTVAGTSNVHEWTASSTTVTVTRAQLGAGAVAGPGFWTDALKPGVVEAFEITIPVATLKSPKGDIDQNMQKALKMDKYPDITFRLVRFEAKEAGTRAIGTLRIAGIDRQIALDLTTKPGTSNLTVQGSLDFLMTDFGIEPPKAMMGMLKTDPKVKVTFEVVLGVPLT